MKQLLYVVGEPGIGKSTAVREATERFWRADSGPRLPRDKYPRRELLFRREDSIVMEQLGFGAVRPTAVELGYRREKFSGTDALPMDAVIAAERYILDQDEADLVIAEGARLGVRRFIDAARAAGYGLHLVYLYGAEAAAARRTARGSAQSESWVRGASTRAKNLAQWYGSAASCGAPNMTVYGLDVSAEGAPGRAVKHVLDQVIALNADSNPPAPGVLPSQV